MLFIVGCRTSPVHNVINAPIVAPSEASPDMAKVRAAIIKAGVGLGWQMNPVESGHIVATLNIRSHQAVVDITYNTKDYDIEYKNSVNLKYNGSTIHSQYNNWVKNLDRAIQQELASELL